MLRISNNEIVIISLKVEFFNKSILQVGTLLNMNEDLLILLWVVFYNCFWSMAPLHLWIFSGAKLWQNINVLPIPKKYKANNPEKWRLKEISTVLFKIMENLITYQLVKYLEAIKIPLSPDLSKRKEKMIPNFSKQLLDIRIN